MFKQLTQFALSDDEFITYDVADISEKRTPNAVSVFVIDAQGERWIDLPHSHYNSRAHAKFRTAQAHWLMEESRQRRHH
jgi:hypothetical protein